MAQLQERGVKLSVPQEGIEVFQQYLKDKPEVPLIESGKNDRFITLNGFRDSLMTLTIHDVVDHFLVTSLLRESGIEGRYRDFFAAIGNPADTDLFSREGEVLASVVYSRRVVGMVEQGIKPTFTVERILRLLEKSENVTPNQEEAARYLREVVAPDAELSHQFSYVVTSTIIELLEQRRKQGFVRMLNDEFDIVRNMSLVEPEYIALMVDTVKMLNELEPRMQMFTGNAAVLIEEFFRHLCAGGQLPPNLEGRVRQEEGKPQELVMRAADLMDDSVAEQSTLPEDVVQWIYDNPGFTATQQALR